MPVDPVPATDESLAKHADAALHDLRSALDQLVRIPSISAPGFDPAQVRGSAEATLALLRTLEPDNSRLLEIEDAHPAAYAEWAAADSKAPTVLLYAHHDVQPVGAAEDWSFDCFDAVERDGRLWGRGVADDKGAIVVHAAAIAAWREHTGGVPVTVKVIVEGEEEIGSPHVEDFLERYTELFRADVVVLLDAVNWSAGAPSVQTSLRGIIDCIVQVRTLERGVHSGLFGGPAPDAMTTLVRLLATLVDDDNRVVVPGLHSSGERTNAAQRAAMQALHLDVDRWRSEAGLLSGVASSQDDIDILTRLWREPCLSVIGVDAVPVDGSSNTLIPSARARLSVRLAPDKDPQEAMDALVDWLTIHVPHNAQLSVSPGALGAGVDLDVDGPVLARAREALEQGFGEPVSFTGVGGGIPFVAAYRHRYGAVPMLLTAIQDPGSRAHGVDESLSLADLRSACVAEMLLLGRLARPSV